MLVWLKFIVSGCPRGRLSLFSYYECRIPCWFFNKQGSKNAREITLGNGGKNRVEEPMAPKELMNNRSASPARGDELREYELEIFVGHDQGNGQ